jgi:hypothetical protein
MKEKYNIDRLFQEQLKDFEATPGNQVWHNIEAELKKDKKPKVIPIWLKYSGIAAAFFLGLFILNTNQTSDLKTENRIVISKNSNSKKDISFQKHPKETQKEAKIVVNSKENSKYKKEILNNHFLKPIAKDEKKIRPYNFSNTLDEPKKNQNDAGIFLSKNNLPIKQLATNDNNTNFSSLNADKIGVENSNSDAYVQNQILEKKDLKEKEESKKQPSINPESPNELEEILKAKSEQKKAVASNSKNKWQITPNVAPVYLNSNSGGSPIDQQLSNYEKKADKSISLGIGIQYAFSKKIVFRSGINKVVLGYETDNVMYSTGLRANNLTNIHYSSDNTIKFVNEMKYSSLSTFEKEIQSTNSGTLNQKMGYYELPMEISYAVLNKKFGINLIGGFSTLFLNENSISLVSSQSKIKLGEAKNLNQVHFSTNVGFGFKYQIIKSFQINVEPMVKYQVNTFSNNAGDFKPLFIGLYSGISYGF